VAHSWGRTQFHTALRRQNTHRAGAGEQGLLTPSAARSEEAHRDRRESEGLKITVAAEKTRVIVAPDQRSINGGRPIAREGPELISDYAIEKKIAHTIMDSVLAVGCSLFDLFAA
jgi:hypothetical protein